MYANQLIGKRAIRNKPVKLREEGEGGFGFVGVQTATYDYSYTSEPILILAATESHIVYQYAGRDLAILGEEKRILNCRYCDDGWANYDELMELAEESNMKLMQETNEIIKEV